MEINGGPHTENNLSPEMRSYSAYGYNRGHMAGVGNYLHGLGMDAHQVHQYAGFFAGSSETVRHAIRSHVRSGERLTDEHVTNPNDARAIKREDAPPSVQRLMDEMRNRGVDPATADPREIHRYLEANPQALEAARQQALSDENRVKGDAQQVRQERVENRDVRTQTTTNSTVVAAPTL